jgi:protein SCO1/2
LRHLPGIVGVALSALALAGCGGGSPGTERAAAPTPPKRYLGAQVPGGAPAYDFALRDQQGDRVRLSEQRGRLVFVTFLYTHCRDVCPLIADNLNSVVRGLGPRGDDVRVLAVSVDPRGDTRTAVRRFAWEHHLLPQFHYLTGTQRELQPVWQGYNVVSEPGANPDRVAHTASIFLIDRHGRPRLFYPPGAPAKTLSHDLSVLLRAGA